VKRLLAIAAAIAALLLGAHPAPAAESCGPKGAKRLFSTSRVVVTYVRTERGATSIPRRHYACARGSARAYVLDDPAAEDDEFGEFWDAAYMFRTNRRYLAYARDSGDDHGDYIKTEIVVLNTVTGRRRIDAVIDAGERYTPFNYATDLVVSSRGIAAWIAVEGLHGEEPQGPYWVQRARRGKGPAVTLDSDEDVAPHSLTLGADDRTAVWRRGSERRTAPLR
jgi:hypothetical protein